ncbi:hypothetical protein LX87_04033 [Larkinella arboricola]|uniref:Uncharacterized protein n=1 Tax=Larkinella arboricola TaxID=643671 RepID=A0A327WQB4_LARAB|nr:hypothetical protein [Larkinella arboricola]RAJ94149.1 hypothetical protein LX87_04033 [Larkinella arboricola]
MVESIRSFFRSSNLSKALNEAQQNQYDNQIDAMAACNRKIRRTGKDHSVVKHQQEPLFWVVPTAMAKLLSEEGHTVLEPYKK